MALLQSFNHASRIHSISTSRTSSDREVLLVAGEDKKVSIYLLPPIEGYPGDGGRETPPLLATLSGHANRYARFALKPCVISEILTLSSVKAVDILVWEETTFAATVSSDGRIHLYDLAPGLGSPGSDAPLDCAPICCYDTKGSRLTCVTLAAVDEDQMEESLKRKWEESDESSDGEE
jgi:protein MAK11